MTNSDRLNANELESRVRERTAELEKADQELRAEILERKRAENELVKLKDKLEVEVRYTNILHKLSTQYIEGGDLYSIFQKIIEAAIAITRADKGNIQILDPLTGKLKIVAQRGFKLPFLKFFEFVDTGEAAACGTAMKRMERVIVEDITRSPIFLGSDALDMLLSEGVRAVQSTPLVSRSGQFIGIISTHFSQIHMPSERELILIDILARQAADIIERKRVEEALRQAYEEFQTQSEELKTSKEELQVQSEELRTQTEERQKVCELLNENEKKYRLLFDHSMDAIILTDPRNGGKILSANPAACHMLGWSEKELIGKGRDVMFDLADPALSILLDERARSGSAKAQLTYRRKDGTTFPGEVSTAFFTDNNGKPRTVAIIRDITKRKQAEEALSRERNLLESVMRATDFMLVFLDPQFNFVWVNPAYAESCQMKPEEMVGKNHFALYPHAENEAIFRKVRDTGEGIFYKDKPFVYPDQPERGVTYWDWSLAPVKNSGRNVTGLVLSLRETTKYKQAEEALQKSEERYRMLFTNMTEAFFLAEIIYDKDGKPYDFRYLEVNSAYGLNTGINKEQVLGKSHLEVFPNASPMAIEEFGKVALSGQSTHFEIFSQDTGKYLDIYAFSPEKGKFAAIFRDITEHKQADEDLHKAYEQIQKQSEELQISHEELQAQYKKLQEANKALHESEARLQIIIANSPEIIFEQDHDLRYTWIYNPVSPYSISDVIGKTDADLLPPDQAQQLESIKRRVLNTGMREQALLQLSPGGEPRWFEAIYEPRYDETGQVTGVLSYTRDVTERKQAEELLRQSEERYRTLFDSIDEGFCIIEMIFDASGKPIDYRFLETNPAFERQTGLHEAAGKTMKELVPDHEEHWFDTYGIIALTGEPRHFISEAKPLMCGWYDVYAFQFGERGSNKVAILFNDITEQKESEIKLKETLDNLEHLVKERTAELEKAYYSLKESEGKLKALFKLLPVGVSITDKERNILDVNLALENILALSRSDLLKGKQATRKYLRSDGTEMLFEEFPSVRALKEEGSIQSSEMGIIKENGSIIWTDVSAIALPLSDGQVVITTRDITERKQAEEALAKIDIARQKEIHHRIKNNLQVISSLLDLQAEKFNNKECIKDPEVLEAFRESQNRVISIALIHEELYEGEGTDTLNFSLYLQRLTENLFHTYRLGNTDINLNMDLEEKIFFDMDTAVPLGIVVNELVSNSLKHAFAGRNRGEIRIKLFKEEKAGNESNNDNEELTGKNIGYTLIVSDDGAGTPENIDFENSDTLGLQLVAILVDQLEGEIELKKNQGTEFKIRFNVKQN